MTKGSKGFEIALYNTRNILRIRAWGFWDAALAEKFGNTLQETLVEICANGKAWYMLADFKEISAQSEDVPEMIINQPINLANMPGIKKIGYLGERTARQLQINKLFQESEQPKHAFFDSEPEAIKWLLI